MVQIPVRSSTLGPICCADVTDGIAATAHATRFWYFMGNPLVPALYLLAALVHESCDPRGQPDAQLCRRGGAGFDDRIRDEVAWTL